MRDHPDHVNKILGGMWGAKLNDKTRHRYKELLVKMLENVSFYKKDKFDAWLKKLKYYFLFFSLMNVNQANGKEWKYGLDQQILAQIVWPQVLIFQLVKRHSKIHKYQIKLGLS